EITRERFWRAMVCMRLTTQQPSGPGTPVSRFQAMSPFPLRYELMADADRPGAVIARALRDAGGIRFSVKKIPDELATNLRRLENGEWSPTLYQCNRLRRLAPREVELEVVAYIQDKFTGFGPKQSRNLLTNLGLTRYEIPIDSRVTSWLNEFGFP